MRWWNQGAPQTKVSRSIGGGAWSVIQTFGPLPANAYIDFRDLQAAPETENCYRVAASDGLNAFSALYTPALCVSTHDDTIGNASRREKTGLYGVILVVSVPLKKNMTQ